MKLPRWVLRLSCFVLAVVGYDCYAYYSTGGKHGVNAAANVMMLVLIGAVMVGGSITGRDRPLRSLVDRIWADYPGTAKKSDKTPPADPK